MKPRRPTEYEVFNSNVKQIITKSDTITENVQRSKVPYKLDSYIGTSNYYFSDNGFKYIEGKADVVFKFSNLPFRVGAYNKLQTSTYCKPFVKAGPSANGDGVKKYYTSTSFTTGTTLGVNRYLSTEIINNEVYYYFIGDGTDKTTSGTKYYIKSVEVINNYLVPFYDAIITDKIIYPLVFFVNGVFIPWSRCYFAVSYGEYRVYVNLKDLKYDSSTYLSDLVINKLYSGEMSPIIYVLPFEVKYGENERGDRIINQSDLLFCFDKYGKSRNKRARAINNDRYEYFNYIQAAFNIKTSLVEFESNYMYEEISDLFYFEIAPESSYGRKYGRTILNFSALDRIRKIFPNNVIVFNRTYESSTDNVTLCDETVRIYNNILYVGDGTEYYDQNVKVFFDYNSALSLTNLEFVSQNWLLNYTDILVDFYSNHNVDFSDSGEHDVHVNENKQLGLKVVDGVLNMEYDPINMDNFNMYNTTQLGYTVKDGILCVQYNDENKNSEIINDNFISEQLNSGSLFVRQSMDNDIYNFDELVCYFQKASEEKKTYLPIDKATFFNLYNKIYHEDIYNANKGKLPMMDQTTADDKTFEIKSLGRLSSINSYRPGSNVSLSNMSFNDIIFIDKLKSESIDPVGVYKFIYEANNPNNDRYGYAVIDSELQPGSGINPDSLKLRSSKFIINLLKDNLDSALGIKVGEKQYIAKEGYSVYTSYTYATKANIPDITTSDGKLLSSIYVEPENHKSFCFTYDGNTYYVKEYLNETYDSSMGMVINKTGVYCLDVIDYSGMLTLKYDETSYASEEAKMNDVQLSNSVVAVTLGKNTTVKISDIIIDIDINKYTENFEYNFLTGPITTNFVCVNGGSLTYVNTGATVTVSDENLLYKYFGNLPGEYVFVNNGGQWFINGSTTLTNLSDCGIVYSGTDSFIITIENNTYPTWSLSGNSVDIEEVYGVSIKGICNANEILSLVYTRTITGLIEETFDTNETNPQDVMNDYLQLKLVNGVTNVVYGSYAIDNEVDPDRVYPGRIEFVYTTPLNHWVVTVYKEIAPGITYKDTYNYSNLDGFGIEFTGSPVNGDTFVVDYEPPEFVWNLYKASNTNTDSFVDGYIFGSSDSPIDEDIVLSDYGVNIYTTIVQTNIVNAKIYNENTLADKLKGVTGTYIFTYSANNNCWIMRDEIISSIEEYGIDIGNSTPVDQDFITVEFDTSNKPSWMDSMFVTMYEVDTNCIEFPDGTYYNEDIAISIIKNSYGVDISDFYNNMNVNDKLVINYHSFIEIPRYILNLLINKFDYYNKFLGDKSLVEDSYASTYDSYDQKITDIYKAYKLYEYQISTMMLNNQSILDDYLNNTFKTNIRFVEYTVKEMKDKGIFNTTLKIPSKNKTVNLINFYRTYINSEIDLNMTEYKLNLNNKLMTYHLSDFSKNYYNTNPVEFIYFDNIDNSEKPITILNDGKYRKYDPSYFNENMRLYTTIINPNNEYEYPEEESEEPINMYFNVEYDIDKIVYRGILTPGDTEENSIYTPAATKGDFYYLKNNGYVNDTNITNATTYRLLLCTRDVYDAKEIVFDEIKPSTENDTCWKLVQGSSLIDGLTNDYSVLVIDQEYINIKLEDSEFYNQELTIVSNNRMKHSLITYRKPTGDYPAKDNDMNVLSLPEEVFKYCDDPTRYMIFIREKNSTSANKIHEYVSSDQYRISIPNDYKSPYYSRKVFFTFNIPDSSFITVLYVPVSMETVEFRQVDTYKDGTIIFDINYESKKNNHYTFNSDLYMVFADGKKIPQSWIKKMGPDRLCISNPLREQYDAGYIDISFNNVSIVRCLPTTLKSRFDTYIDSNELDTFKSFDLEDPNFMRYIVKVGLTKNDILSIIEKLTYRHNYASTGTSYYIDDDLTLNNYGYGMSEFLYWLYNDSTLTSAQKLAVFDYKVLNMKDINSFENNNRFVESTIKLIRKFYIENTLVEYNSTHGSNNDPHTFNYMDNIAAKSEGLTSNTRYANDPNNTYVYPVLQEYRINTIHATYNITNLITNGKTTIDYGNVEYSFYLYPINDSILPKIIWIKLNSEEEYLVEGSDYSYNSLTGLVTIYNITEDFTVTAYAERISYITVTKNPNKTIYYTTEKFDPTGMEVSIRWINGDTEVIPSDQYTFSPYDELLTTDITEITITYSDGGYFFYETKLPITVYKATEELVYELDEDGNSYHIGILYSGEYGSGLSSIPEDGIVTIPDTIINPESGLPLPVKSIVYSAFRNLNINTVSFGSNIETVGEYAFDHSNITSVSLNYGLKNISNNAFSYCSNLTSINVPNTVTEIDSDAFKSDTSMEYATLPNNLTLIKSGLFNNCRSLLSIDIPDDVYNICTDSFKNCSSLAIVNFSNNSKLRIIEYQAFSFCSNLKSFNIPKNSERIEIVEEAFSYSGLESIVIPNNVTYVYEFAFNECQSLQSVIFEAPDYEDDKPGILSLHGGAFYRCRNLTYVELGFSQSDYKCTDTFYPWFNGCNNNLTIKVPKSVYDEGVYDYTNTYYGSYWNYIGSNRRATYYSEDS